MRKEKHYFQHNVFFLCINMRGNPFDIFNLFFRTIRHSTHTNIQQLRDK